MPIRDPKEAKELINRRHPEHSANCVRLRWLLDSLEGGQAYRDAVYGHGYQGLPIRNLIRHKREYPLPSDTRTQVTPSSLESRASADASASANFDDYEARRSRTPVPCLVGHAVGLHLARVYSREVIRGFGIETEGTEDATEGASLASRLESWWRDVDGTGLVSMDVWMREEVAPQLLAAGQVDILLDRPKAPDGVAVTSLAAEKELQLDRCLAAVLRPEKVLWWKLDPVTREYREVLIEECHEMDDGSSEEFYRHWTQIESTLYDCDGEIVESIEHPYGRPPIVRIFYRRNTRYRNIGVSNYEEIAELQRAAYNRLSELAIADVLQAFPLLQGPPEIMATEIPVGPGWGIPMFKDSSGNYHGLSFVDPPKGSVESLRQHLLDDLDRADRVACLLKPAGATESGTVSQSGISKAFDAKEGNTLLCEIAEKLATAERVISSLALTVLLGRPATRQEIDRIQIKYSKEFDLWSATDLAEFLLDLQKITAGAGDLPQVEAMGLKLYVREWLKGLSDDQYSLLDASIDGWLADKIKMKANTTESLDLGKMPTDVEDELDQVGGVEED